MMELALIKTLLNRDFYEQHKGIRCPDKIFTKDVRKIKQALDAAMRTYEGDLNTADLEALFYAQNQTMTTATKTAYSDLFRKINKEQVIKEEIATDVLGKMFQQYVGEQVANLGFDFVNGTQTSLEPLRRMLENYKDDFTPNLRIEWEDISIDTLLKANDLQTQWKFNIPSLRRKVEGVSGGHLLLVGARPNTGKTSFHASLIAGPEGWARQGAKCVVLCNEEAYERVGARYLSAASNMSMDEVKGNVALARSRYEPVRANIRIKDSTNKDMQWVESLVKQEKPDVLILDMGDKFASKTSDKSDVYLKDAAIYARNIAKQYNCCVVWMSQLSAVAEGKVYVDQSMMEGSKTGKAAEADLMVLISKNPIVEGADEEDTQRHLNIAKNKLKGGWHGVVHCELDGARSLYTA
jgi:RNase H-fold protein (predicted Holliday junction resolvase)